MNAGERLNDALEQIEGIADRLNIDDEEAVPSVHVVADLARNVHEAIEALRDLLAPTVKAETGGRRG